MNLLVHLPPWSQQRLQLQARHHMDGDCTSHAVRTSQEDLRSLQGRLPTYLPSISRSALAPVAGSLKLTKP